MDEQSSISEKTKSKGKGPVDTVRKGAIAAHIWRRQSPGGFPYYDFSLSRSWKSMSSEKTGYSSNFFETNEAELVEAIAIASKRIIELKEEDKLAYSKSLAA